MRTILAFFVILLLGSCESSNPNLDDSKTTERLWNEENRKFIISELSRTIDELVLEIQDITVGLTV